MRIECLKHVKLKWGVGTSILLITSWTTIERTLAGRHPGEWNLNQLRGSAEITNIPALCPHLHVPREVKLQKIAPLRKCV